MARPRKGTPGHIKAHKKWQETMLKKYGSEEALTEQFKKIGKLGGSKSANKGFASTKRGEDGLTGPERARLVGAIGGFKSRRGRVKEVES